MAAFPISTIPSTSGISALHDAIEKYGYATGNHKTHLTELSRIAFPTPEIFNTHTGTIRKEMTRGHFKSFYDAEGEGAYWWNKVLVRRIDRMTSMNAEYPQFVIAMGYYRKSQRRANNWILNFRRKHFKK